MNKIRVLVADDHTIVREGVRILLEAQPDIEVVGEAADGQEALERVRELQPDIVLIDIAMPNLNGLEATRAIKHDYPRTISSMVYGFVTLSGAKSLISSTEILRCAQNDSP